MTKREEEFIMCVQTAAIVKDIQEDRHVAQYAVELAYNQVHFLTLPDNTWVTDFVDDVINCAFAEGRKADWIKEEK